jgi:hypothetical protein
VVAVAVSDADANLAVGGHHLAKGITKGMLEHLRREEAGDARIPSAVALVVEVS